eukprot:RCo045317
MTDDAVKAFGRGTPAGNALYKLYHRPSAPSTLDPELAKRLAEMRKQREAEAHPKPKVVPKSKAHVSVPKLRGRPSAVDEGNRVSRMPLRFGGKKPAAAIAEEMACQPPPSPPPDSKMHISPEEKQNFQLLMEYNGEIPEKLPTPPKPRPPSPPAQLTSKALYVRIMAEIDERKEFLEEMRALGKAKEYEVKIRQEISQRLAELKRLERIIAEESSGR